MLALVIKYGAFEKLGCGFALIKISNNTLLMLFLLGFLGKLFQYELHDEDKRVVLTITLNVSFLKTLKTSLKTYFTIPWDVLSLVSEPSLSALPDVPWAQKEI